MTKWISNPLRPEIGQRYRLREYFGGEYIGQVFEIDRRRGLIYVRDCESRADFMWTRTMWRRACIARVNDQSPEP